MKRSPLIDLQSYPSWLYFLYLYKCFETKNDLSPPKSFRFRIFNILMVSLFHHDNFTATATSRTPAAATTMHCMIIIIMTDDDKSILIIIRRNWQRDVWESNDNYNDDIQPFSSVKSYSHLPQDTDLRVLFYEATCQH